MCQQFRAESTAVVETNLWESKLLEREGLTAERAYSEWPQIDNWPPGLPVVEL
jgi:hypothetical protein